MPDWKRYVRDHLALDHVRPEREERIVRELASNLEDLYADGLARGLSPAEAEAAATRHIEDWSRLGQDLSLADPSAGLPPLDRLADRLDDATGEARPSLNVFAGVSRDLVHAVRRLRGNPGFTAVAVVILALGIGANAAMFNLVDTFLFRPLPFARSAELVRVFEDDDDGKPGTCSYPTYQELASQRGVFAGAAPVIVGRRASWMRPTGEARLVSVAWVGSSYFPVIGLPPSLGRPFLSQEDVNGGPAAAVISHRLWQEAFGGAPSIVGEMVTLSGAPVTIVGVGPRGYGGIVSGHAVDFWLSLSSLGPIGGSYAGGTMQRRDDHWFDVIARLAPGATPATAQAAAAVIAARLGREFPEYHRGRDITVFRASDVRIQPAMDSSLYPAGSVLMGVAGLVLLVGCTNLAGLLLARGWRRGHELSIRLALGSTRWRLVRQLLVESLLLGLTGGALGIVVAAWGSRLLVSRADVLPLPINLSLSLDVRVVAFTFVLSLATGLAFGILPALRVTRPDLVAGLKDPESAVGGSPAGRRRRFGLSLRNLFLVSQVAASMILLVAAGLLLRGVHEARQVDLGFRAADRLALLEADAGEAGLSEAAASSLWRDFLDRTGGLPGVESVTWATRLPLSRAGSSTLVIDEYRARTGAETAEVDSAWVAPSYFDTLRIPLLHGRLFTNADAEANRRVAVVSQAMARRYWGRTDIVGARYRHQGSATSWVEVIGVVGDVKVRSAGEGPTPIFYRALPVGAVSRLYAVARTSGPADAVAAAMRRTFREAHPGVPIYEVGTMETHLGRSLTLHRAAAATVALFGAVALLLAAIGLYGVVASSVVQRTSEVGIRMALGARSGQVVSMLVREVMVLVAAGSGVGLLAAWLLAPGLRSLVFGASVSDPVTLAGVTLLLTAVALLATWLPARRAVTIGPLAAMRQK